MGEGRGTQWAVAVAMRRRLVVEQDSSHSTSEVSARAYDQSTMCPPCIATKFKKQLAMRQVIVYAFRSHVMLFYILDPSAAQFADIVWLGWALGPCEIFILLLDIVNAYQAAMDRSSRESMSVISVQCCHGIQRCACWVSAASTIFLSKSTAVFRSNGARSWPGLECASGRLVRHRDDYSITPMPHCLQPLHNVHQVTSFDRNVEHSANSQPFATSS